jgi:hypothetical protein
MRITATQIVKNVNLTTTQDVIRRIITVAPLGERGFGVPSGGTTGQVLAKKTGTNYDTEWVEQTGGGGGISDAPNNANAYVRSGLAWVIGYTKTAIDALISGFQTAGQVQAIADGKVSDTAYDEGTWNGVTTIAPSKNAVRDKIETLDSSVMHLAGNETITGIKTFGTNIKLLVPYNSVPTISGINADGKLEVLYTGTYPNQTEISYVKGVTSAIQAQLNAKQATLTETIFGTFINGLTAKNTLVDADEVVSDDSADSSKAKKTSWLNVWTNYLKPKADALYQAILVSGTNIKTINGSSVLGSGDLTVSGSTPSQSAYTILANNTASSAVPTERPFENITNATYDGATPTWTGTTAPSGTTQHTYSLSQVGNIVTLIINLSYQTAGSNLTSVSCELPSTAPTPALPTSVTATGEIISFAIGWIHTSKTLPTTSLPFCAFRLKSTSPDVFEVIVTRTIAAHRYGYITLQYFV